MLSVLCAPGCEDIDERWFSPAFWGGQALPVASGGRGSAWFVDSPKGQLVLRHYLRGGLVARFFRRSYMFAGFDRARSFSEFRLLNELRERALPVPSPVAALVSRQGPLFYRAAILVEKIEGATPLPEHPAVDNEALWRRVGQTVALFHREGLDHVDLNCDNILVAGDKIYLIDFDRCRLRPEMHYPIRWKDSNLRRLHRSVDKRCHAMTESKRDALWRSLLDGYHEAVQ